MRQWKQVSRTGKPSKSTNVRAGAFAEHEYFFDLFIIFAAIFRKCLIPIFRLTWNFLYPEYDPIDSGSAVLACGLQLVILFSVYI